MGGLHNERQLDSHCVGAEQNIVMATGRISFLRPDHSRRHSLALKARRNLHKVFNWS